MNAINLFIGGKDRPATGNAVYERRNPISGEVASTVAAATVEDAVRAADSAAAAFPAWSALGPTERRARLDKAATILASRTEEFAQLMMAEIGATAGWAGFNVMLAAGMLREAAAMTTQIAGEVIPTDKPNNLAHGISPARRRRARHRALECAGDPGRARDRHAARLRQYGGPQSLRGQPRRASSHRPVPRRGRPGRRRRQCRHQRAGGCAGHRRGADRPHGHPARELHGIDAGRPDRGADRGEALEALPARTGRQGPARHPRRCRHRRGGEGGGLRRLHEPGPDLHVDRADRGRRGRGRCVRREVRRQGQVAAERRPPQGQRRARLAGGAAGGRPRQRADRRRHRQGWRGLPPAASRRAPSCPRPSSTA